METGGKESVMPIKAGFVLYVCHSYQNKHTCKNKISQKKHIEDNLKKEDISIVHYDMECIPLSHLHKL